MAIPFLVIDEFGEQGITLPRIEQSRAAQRTGLAFLVIDELGEQSVAFLRFQRCRFALRDTSRSLASREESWIPSSAFVIHCLEAANRVQPATEAATSMSRHLG